MSAPPLPKIVFGLVVPPAGSGLGERVDRLASWMSERLGIPIERRDAASYEALADDVREGRTDVAWLPPIVYLRLGDAVTPLGSILRGGAAAYEAALIVRASSKIRTIDALRGTRAGWVDRWSAAGFVLPRVKLAILGEDPRTLFRTETFHGSHRSAIQALLEGACDVAGTYAQADEEGNVSAGAWSEIDGADVRVLATFGAIPPDVLAVRTAVADRIRDKAFGAFKDACSDASTRDLIRGVFGGDDLTEGLAPGYDTLQKALDVATARGIFG
ncbi:MAG: phosphate/phosphite/phosphonate ABC transporter substrate-binding protein [Labilithrix sp.]|nr:phosphate/phosphite/phosphonate ABC transporter substrate-binding protein [Labilithrix sp.]MCW5833062.1 phosphate/phosphite/phosphonate ABC transporter substrate-binding protein [Labilithrix sp.]